MLYTYNAFNSGKPSNVLSSILDILFRDNKLKQKQIKNISTLTIDWLIDYWLTDLLLIDWLIIDWLIDYWLTDWLLINWLTIDWLIDYCNQ
jgi:hypothetical protein